VKLAPQLTQSKLRAFANLGEERENTHLTHGLACEVKGICVTISPQES
jgi:hypothetical protein